MDSIVPVWAKSNHSNQLNGDDLTLAPVIVTVSGCDIITANGEVRLSISVLELEKPYKPCKIMAKVLFQVWGGEIERWIGRRLELFRDPRVTAPDAGGKGVEKVGGIRISRVSGISEPFTASTVTGRMKRGQWKLNPIHDNEEGSQAAFVAAKISGAETDSQLQAAVDSGKNLPADVRKRMAGIFSAAQARIRAGAQCLKNGETGYGNVTPIWCKTGCGILGKSGCQGVVDQKTEQETVK
jgi:hypothetical protein